MGATNCPETPRQRMIGMMYLVLTAMLALNVSKDILDAFVVVDETMVKTNENFEKKIGITYQQFANANMNAPEKTGPFYKKALEVQKKTKEIVEFIMNLKYEMIAESEGIPLEEAKKLTLRQVQGKDKYDVSTHFLMGTGEGRGNGKAKELRNKIQEYKTFLLKFIDDPKVNAEYKTKLGLDTETPSKNAEGASEEWETHNFFHIVLAADVTILNKLIGEIKNAEFDMLTYLMTSIDQSSFKFDNVSARVIPDSRLVFQGQDYTADIIVAAFDSRQNPEVYYKMGLDTANENMVSSMQKIDGKDGVVQLKLPGGGTGEQKFAGLIKIKAPDGTDKYYPFKSKFVVTKPMANVSADSLRILYEGIDNLVTIAAPVSPEKLRINFGGCVNKGLGNGRYNVKPVAGSRLVTISVSADMDGRTQAMGGTPFRVKRVPDPLASSGGRYGGKITKGELSSFGRIAAGMSSDFPYMLRWVVSSYKVTVKSASGSGEKNEYTNNGSAFDSKTLSMINSAAPGTRITFDEIQTSNPILGVRTTLNTLTFKIR